MRNDTRVGQYSAARDQPGDDCHRTKRTSSILNVRSVTQTALDLTARARIRDAAIRRFGVEGFGASVRAIAADAGVSPGLVIHHFGSKDRLRAVCDEQVLRLIREAETDAFTSRTPADLISQLALLDDYAPLVGYLIQALLAGGDLAATLLARLTSDAEDYLAAAVASGRMRPSRDPAARAAYLVDVGIGVLLAFVRRNPPVNGDYQAMLRAYAETHSLPALELYTEGLLTDSTMLDAYLRYRAERSATPDTDAPERSPS